MTYFVVGVSCVLAAALGFMWGDLRRTRKVLLGAAKNADLVKSVFSKAVCEYSSGRTELGYSEKEYFDKIFSEQINKILSSEYIKERLETFILHYKKEKFDEDLNKMVKTHMDEAVAKEVVEHRLSDVLAVMDVRAIGNAMVLKSAASLMNVEKPKRDRYGCEIQY